MKILYVEDELPKNIPRIIRLFSTYLKGKRIKALERLETDTAGRAARPEDIQRVVEETHVIDVEYRFPEALDSVLHRHKDYDLFIIDRNLSESEYDFEEARQTDPNFTEAQYDKFFEREGDYLLHRLIFENVNVMDKAYLLTAYSPPIQGHEDIQHLIDFGKFNLENFIDKSSDQTDFNRLKHVIDHLDTLKLRFENKRYLTILSSRLEEQKSDWFYEIIRDKDKPDKIKATLTTIRNLYEAMLNACPRAIPDMAATCTDGYGKVKIGKETIDWLDNNGHINSIHRNFFFSISKICSSFGAHSGEPGYQPTTDTTNALVYALKDAVVWFGNTVSDD